MSNPTPPPGSIGWFDLTVESPGPLLDFYAAVVGWRSTPVGMQDDDGGYEDYLLLDGADSPVAGLCHARGTNREVPAAWLTYVVVEDLDRSLAAVKARGGRVELEPRSAGGGRMAVIQDPAGIRLALYAAAGEQ